MAVHGIETYISSAEALFCNIASTKKKMVTTAIMVPLCIPEFTVCQSWRTATGYQNVIDLQQVPSATAQFLVDGIS